MPSIGGSQRFPKKHRIARGQDELIQAPPGDPGGGERNSSKSRSRFGSLAYRPTASANPLPGHNTPVDPQAPVPPAIRVLPEAVSNAPTIHEVFRADFAKIASPAALSSLRTPFENIRAGSPSLVRAGRLSLRRMEDGPSRCFPVLALPIVSEEHSALSPEGPSNQSPSDDYHAHHHQRAVSDIISLIGERDPPCNH